MLHGCKWSIIFEKTHDKSELIIAFTEIYLRSLRPFYNCGNLVQRSERSYSNKVIDGIGTKAHSWRGPLGISAFHCMARVRYWWPHLLPVSWFSLHGGETKTVPITENVEPAQSWLLLLFSAGCKEEAICWHGEVLAHILRPGRKTRLKWRNIKGDLCTAVLMSG